MNELFDRMMRAARLETMLYEEVEHDPGATSQAMVVVLIPSTSVLCPRTSAAGLLRWSPRASTGPSR